MTRAGANGDGGAMRYVGAVGNFDGVHRGHQYLLRETATLAQELGATPAAVVFSPHPRRFFQPETPAFRLMTDEMRERVLMACGAARVFTARFDAAMAALSPDAFVGEVLQARFGLVGVVVGAEFRFGARRAGDAAALERIARAKGLASRIVRPLAGEADAEKIGSSAIRAALADGDVAAAARMLGRPWTVGGDVLAGRKLGRTIGFPTANLTLGDLIEPRCGVYAVRATVDGDVRPAIANFGRRPTVGGGAPLLETHIFDFEGDLYGKRLEAAFVEFIREERKFDGLEALQRQINEDCTRARAIHAAHA